MDVQKERSKDETKEINIAEKILEKEKEIREWWFDSELGTKTVDADKQIKDNLKQYYAFLQVFHHDEFRNSTIYLEKVISELINLVEKEYWHYGRENRRLGALVLGAAYRRLGQFKIERYQKNVETEYSKANQYLEKDTSFLDKLNSSDNGDFIIMLLFILNKAKYFRDIAENGDADGEAGYWRAYMLFREIINKIDGREENSGDSATEGVIARIYINAQLNIVRVQRLLQNDKETEKECAKLICICKNSLSVLLEKNKLIEKEKNRVEKLSAMVQNLEMEENFAKRFFIIKKACIDEDNKAVRLFEDYILQVLVQLGIFYRDSIDFNCSENGRKLIKKTIYIFLLLGALDRIMDSNSENIRNDADVNEIEEAMDALKLTDFNFKSSDKEKLKKLKEFVDRIKVLCISEWNDKKTEICKKSKLKNSDAKNNLAICLKKLGYFNEAIEILKDLCAEKNRFAEYNLYKCYLESGATKQLEEVREYCCRNQETNNNLPYVNLDKIEESNPKWLFQYARYLVAIGTYEKAEKLFHYVSMKKPIRWNSIGLKAAYLEAQCLIQRGKYLLAMNILSYIHHSLLKANAEKSKQRLEIRTEIDLGWCRIKENRYDEAYETYSNLINYLATDEDNYGNALINIINLENSDGRQRVSYEKEKIRHLLKKLKEALDDVKEDKNEKHITTWDDIDCKHQMRLLHNLYNCSLYKEDGSEDKNSGDKRIDELIEELCKLNLEQDVWLLFLKQLKYLNDNMESNCDLEKLSENLAEVLRVYPNNTMVYSCWAISKTNFCLELFRKNEEAEKEEKELLLKGMIYSATPLTMKGYIEIAKVVLEKGFLDIYGEGTDSDSESLEYTFLETFCNAKLLENGTNRAFMNLMANSDFHSIEISIRAELLAMTLELYGYIRKIKNLYRVTYKDLKKRSGKDESVKPIIYHYTRLNTIKGILLKKEETHTNNESVEEEPKFRLSNVARMNDACEGSVFKDYFKSIIAEKECESKNAGTREIQEYWNDEKKKEDLIEKYVDNMSDFQTDGKLSAHDSDVYIACFSMNSNNFGLWSNYADDEKGCIIGFDAGFFDFVDKNDNFIPDDEAEENALYKVLYVREKKLFNINRKETENQHISTKNNYLGEAERWFVNSDLREEKIIEDCFLGIWESLIKIEMKLKEGKAKNNQETISFKAAGVVRAFITDRLNEIRFLFKSESYFYEEELRMIRCSHEPYVENSDTCMIPRLYINVEKKLENLTLILGSRVEQQQFKELSVWARSTDRVKQVIWSGLNRLK